MNNEFDALKDAVETCRTVAREHGIPHIAALLPDVEILRDPDDFVFIQERLATVQKLLSLRPPSVQVVLQAFGHAKARAATVEKLLRTDTPD